jgi:hypothetical protein
MTQYNREEITAVENAEQKAVKKKLAPSAIAGIVIVCALVVAFSIFLPFYLKSNEPNRELYKNEQIKITANGEEIGVYKIDDLLALEGVEEVEFNAIYDTSSSEPVEKTYTGIELKKVLSALGVDLSVARTIVFKASDGANKAYAAEDIVNPNNVFIAYKVNGRAFNEGIKAAAFNDEAEDGGPFVVIKVSDTYSQNRCKLLTEVSVS